MFEQIDVAFQNGLMKHAAAMQQQYDSTHSPLVMTLRVCAITFCLETDNDFHFKFCFSCDHCLLLLFFVVLDSIIYVALVDKDIVTPAWS